MTEQQQPMIPESWKRAMQRATEAKLQAIKLDETRYIVKSRRYIPGMYHMVSLDEQGKIIECSRCPGWEHGGRHRPCYHAGAVAARIYRETYGKRALAKIRNTSTAKQSVGAAMPPLLQGGRENDATQAVA